MSNGLNFDDPVAVALTVFRAFQASRIEAALYGGLALAAYGEPRETRDADFAVLGVGGAEAIGALAGAVLNPVLTFDRVRFGGNLISRIALVEGGGAAGLHVADLVEPRSPRFAREALRRAVTGSLRGMSIRVLSPEDFILFKVLSTRERDLEDAATIFRALGPQLDRSLIVAEANLLAAEIPDHDVVARLARLPTDG
ncbi:MAG: hypothetical protein HYU41_23610 [Candidatus Rokubacteria bacterium]|nr:hypothetical protein [Candidatus Rokubacteria bacterium]